jgi:hypothetical protein
VKECQPAYLGYFLIVISIVLIICPSSLMPLGLDIVDVLALERGVVVCRFGREVASSQ